MSNSTGSNSTAPRRERPARSPGGPLIWVIRGAFLLLLVSLTAAMIRAVLVGRGGLVARLPIYGEVDDFTLTGTDGRAVELAELADRVWIADFIFTRCRTTCPRLTAEMALLAQELADWPELRFVSFTVDPAYDTPEVLADYGERFGADRERWLFLTGEKPTLYRLTRKSFHLGVVEAGDEEALLAAAAEAGPGSRAATEPDQASAAGREGRHAANEPFIHSTRFVLVDRQGMIRGYYDSTDPERLRDLRRDARRLLRERPRT